MQTADEKLAYRSNKDYDYTMNQLTRKSTTREVVLKNIRIMGQATVEELAEKVGVSPVTLRHHLNSLMADQLITNVAVRRKVGRPYNLYSLSEEGQELFPKKYFALSSRLLSELKERFSAEVVNDLFQGLVQKIVDEHSAELATLNFEQRLDYLVVLLGEEGFIARWEKDGEQYQIIERNCPFLIIGQQHSEICFLDTTLIAAVMGTPIQQHSCILQGDECCQFTIAPASSTIQLQEVKVQ